MKYVGTFYLGAELGDIVTCALENWGRRLKFFPWYLFTKHSKKKVIVALQKPSGLCYFKQCKKTKFKRRFCLNKLVHPHPGPWNFPPPTIWLGTSGLLLSLLLRYILFWTAPQFFLLVQLFPAPPPAGLYLLLTIPLFYLVAGELAFLNIFLWVTETGFLQGPFL